LRFAQANAPAIAAACSGAAAAKLAYDRRDGIARRGEQLLHRGGAGGAPQVSRLVVDREQLPPVVVSYLDDE
jgi:hypothetical protein